MNTNMSLAVERIRDTVSAQDVGAALGIEIRRGRCKCPVHNGGDFNCVLYRGNRGFYCHTCKAGGNVIQLVQDTVYHSREKDTFRKAVEWLNQTFQLGLSLDSTLSPDEERRAKNALKMRKNRIELDEWLKRMKFNLALTADDIVRRLETIRDQRRPRTYGEEWDESFCTAVTLLPEARQVAEDMISDCMEVHT